MLRFLFPRLTRPEPRGAKLFAAAVAEARRPLWYAELGVPDTLDGRFSVLATVTALVTVRLEQGDEAAQQASVALAERFIESMDHEHRQLGYGDPTIGKIVRKLTASLGRRAGLFRSVVESGAGWPDAAESSLKALDGQATDQASELLQELWGRLAQARDEEVIDGRWG